MDNNVKLFHLLIAGFASSPFCVCDSDAFYSSALKN